MPEFKPPRPGEVAVPLPDHFDASLYFIGRARTPWATPSECPKSSRGRVDVVATLEIDPRFAAGLKDVELYSHIIVLYWLHHSRRDLIVAGHAAALVYDDQPESAAQALRLLAYANTQLLEYRFYDELLTPVLADVYRRSARKRSVFAYMNSGKEAARLNALRLEVMELSERTDTAIKFLSDMYWARVYKLAAARIGVPDYRNLVEQKLQAAGELYRFMIDTSHQGTAFVLETVVVIILIIDLVVLFAGKPH